MTKKPKYNYYKVDAGFFPDVVKLCFSDDDFQQILKDHEIAAEINAFDVGIAETHSIGGGRNAIIVLAFDMSLIYDDLSDLISTITHEVSHVVDHLAEYIGEKDGLVGETRAYLSGHLASQVFKICMHQKLKNARKASRSVSKQKSQAAGRIELQMDKLSDWRSGPDRDIELADSLRRAKDEHWDRFTEAEASFLTDCITRLSSLGTADETGH